MNFKLFSNESEPKIDCVKTLLFVLLVKSSLSLKHCNQLVARDSEEP